MDIITWIPILLCVFIRTVSAYHEYHIHHCARRADIYAAVVSGKIPEKCQVIRGFTSVEASSWRNKMWYGKVIMRSLGLLTDRRKQSMTHPNTYPYVIVGVPTSHSFCGIVVSGRPDWDNDRPVMFKVEGSIDGKEWFPAYSGDGTTNFAGPDSGKTKMAVFFANVLIAKKLKVTATKIINGAAAAFRVAPVAHCFYPGDFPIDCKTKFNQGHFKHLPICQPIHFHTIALHCPITGQVQGKDPFTVQSPVMNAAQLLFGDVGQGLFVVWKIRGVLHFKGASKHGVSSTAHTAQWTASAFTFNPKIKKRYCDQQR